MVTKTTSSQPSYRKRLAMSQGLPRSAVALRSELGIAKPELHAVPHWLRSRVLHAVNKRMLPKPVVPLLGCWHALDHVRRCIGGGWLDHYGKLKSANGSEKLISEPYSLNDYDLKQLQEFCWILGLQYRIESCSWWYPGRTLRIVVEEVTPHV